MRLPEYHGDPLKFPHETWDDYELTIQLAYEGAEATDLNPKIKRAHLLTGLQGKARQVLTLNPHLRELEYEELLKQLRNKFNKPQHKQDLGNVVQKPGESVLEFVARLKEAVRTVKPQEFPLYSKEDAKKLAKKDENAEVVSDVAVKEIYKDAINNVLFKYFMKGLREELYHVVMQARPKDLTEAIGIAEEHEHYSEMFGHDASRMSHLTLTDSPPTDHTVNQAAQQLQALNRSKPREGLQKFDPTFVKCYYCDKTGHLARECRKKTLDLHQRKYMSHNNDPPVQPRMPGLRPVRAQASGGPYPSFGNQGKNPNKDAFYKENGYTTYDRQDQQAEVRQGTLRFRQPMVQISQSKNGVRLPQGAGIAIPKPLEARRPRII
jgi:hypothetical protein